MCTMWGESGTQVPEDGCWLTHPPHLLGTVVSRGEGIPLSHPGPHDSYLKSEFHIWPLWALSIKVGTWRPGWTEGRLSDTSLQRSKLSYKRCFKRMPSAAQGATATLLLQTISLCLWCHGYLEEDKVVPLPSAEAGKWYGTISFLSSLLDFQVEGLRVLPGLHYACVHMATEIH